MTRSVFAALLVVLGAAPISAQSADLTPGSTLLRTDRIPAVVDTYMITNYRDGVAWQRSKLVRRIERVSDNGRSLLRYAQMYDTPDGSTVDTTWVDAVTLAPVRYFADVYGETQRFEFTALEARGVVTPKDSTPRPVVHTAAAPFFIAVALDLLYYALVMEDGFSATFDAYNPPRASLRLSLQYVGRERLPLIGGGHVDAAKVGFGSTGSHLWLDARTGALLMHGGGLGGGVAFWKVRSDIDAAALISASLK